MDETNEYQADAFSVDNGDESSNAGSTSKARLTYKFQRLRERLREAVVSGEFVGKLPGERQLARRFRVNAKTLSKALTDLAAEGLLERTIGRGTFVKTAAPSAIEALSVSQQTEAEPATVSQPAPDRWLIVCPAAQASSALIAKLQSMNPLSTIVHDTASLRPSFLSTFKAVIDFDPATPASFLREMVVRNASVVIVGREPSTYSVNAVTLDRMLAASCLARDMILAGHRKFVAVERRGSTQVSNAIRQIAERYAPQAWVEIAYPTEVAAALAQGATAIICDSTESARIVRSSLENDQVSIPGRASLAAMGLADEDIPCSGYYVSLDKKADAIVQSLRDASQHRPAMLWLTGTFRDAHTIAPLALAVEQIADVPADFPRPFATMSLTRTD